MLPVEITTHELSAKYFYKKNEKDNFWVIRQVLVILTEIHQINQYGRLTRDYGLQVPHTSGLEPNHYPSLGGTQGGFFPVLVVALAGWPWLTVTAHEYLCIYNFITPKHSGCDLLPLVNPCKLSSFLHSWNILSQKSLIDRSVKG